MNRLRFGIFLAPFHKPGINPTLALRGDLELIQWLDRCGYDEAWLGEHHSAGTELSASPEIMIAAAAERSVLGRDGEPPAALTRQGAEDLLALAPPVRLGGIEQIQPGIEACLERGDHLRDRCRVMIIQTPKKPILKEP
jgi:hypothetical protein